MHRQGVEGTFALWRPLPIGPKKFPADIELFTPVRIGRPLVLFHGKKKLGWKLQASFAPFRIREFLPFIRGKRIIRS